MAFKSFTVTPFAAGVWELASPKPLMLSGKNGLIARFVRNDKNRATEPWALTPEALLALAALPAEGATWVVLEQTEGEDTRLSRLEKITGVSGFQTEVLLTLSPLTVTGSDATVRVTIPENGRAWIEELALDGGSNNMESTWKWCDRSLNIGATVVGGSKK